MTRILDASISTWIAALVLSFVRSMPTVVSLDCGHCGLNFVARVEDGTSFCSVTAAWSRSNKLLINWRVDLTDAGKLSIYDACAPLPTGDNPHSGADAGTYFTAVNSDE